MLHTKEDKAMGEQEKSGKREETHKRLSMSLFQSPSIRSLDHTQDRIQDQAKSEELESIATPNQTHTPSLPPNVSSAIAANDSDWLDLVTCDAIDMDFMCFHIQAQLPLDDLVLILSIYKATRVFVTSGNRLVGYIDVNELSLRDDI